MVGDMETELASHRSVMTSETTLDDTRSACTAHTDRIDGMLDNMGGALGEMGCMMGF
jgi:hypothetical protein